MIARHRDSTVEEYPPTLDFASELIMRLWLFVATEISALTLGCLLRYTNDFDCAESRSFWLSVRHAHLSGARRVRATRKYPCAREKGEATAAEDFHGAMTANGES